MDAVLHLAESLMGSPWLYLLVLGLTAADGVLPVMPGETVVIAAAAYAVTGEPALLGLLAAAWAGALCGDLVSHQLGRGAGPLARWFRRRRWGGRPRSRTAAGGRCCLRGRSRRAAARWCCCCGGSGRWHGCQRYPPWWP